MDRDPLSGKPHFPPPPTPIKGERTVNPRRRLAPLQPPPSLVPLPATLPPGLSRKCAFTYTHTLSVHILPAAYPRAASTPGRIEVPLPEAFIGPKAKEQRTKRLFETAHGMLAEKVQLESVFPDPKLNARVGEVGLWSTVLRIRRDESVSLGEGKKGITLVTTHPIGFHKEIWEPTFRHLIEMTELANSSIRIEELWSLEAVNHGDAALINGIHIPKLPDRSDYGRDIANFVIHHLPDGKDAFGKDLPLQLTRLPESIATERVKHGFRDRNVVTMGHSLGGDATALCGISYPKLFPAIILLETTLFPGSNNRSKLKPAIIVSTLGRRSSWPSREEAKKALLKSPLFQAFDPEVLNVYVEHGTYKDDKTGQIHLKCPPALEASEFAELRTMNEGWELLPTLDDNVELRWIMGGRDDASNLLTREFVGCVRVGGMEVARKTVWRRSKNASNVKLPGAGHLLVQEKPKDVAEDITLFLTRKFGSGEDGRKAKL
ncbi:Abhydrolase domain-containing protein mpaH [Psilocybe cubensis]|uniref:Abhydrolase domain-containing protein mpaH n=2 Tax=Psilocybe cubensis TaxID=181762 RepID=A0ACB8HAM4_PSICU|nr:Abhydrolase domain-containing protein mpaH [Psilocybe cubensis]KAH9484884.1 Abhydrolase domain-containing protein mpaH [Psilocybe cubensis]